MRLVRHLFQGISLSNDWRQAGARFKELFEEWRRVGSAGKNEDDILWKEFNSARQEFYKRRSKYYSELDEQHANNKQKKQTLISEARSIAQFSTEWKSSGERLNELMDKWKTVGSAGKDNDDSLWKEFNSARQTFYDRRRIYYAEQDRQFQNNADRKSRIVQEASAISSCCDYSSQSTERMKRLSQEWKEVGFAGKENEDRLWSLFRNANDSFWSGKRSYNEQRHQEWRRKQNDAINRKRMKISNLQQQISDLHYKMIGMRNQEYINNMCRWIDEKEAKIRELEIVIRDIESKL